MNDEDLLQLAELLDDFIRMDSGDSTAHGRRADQLLAFNMLKGLKSYGLTEPRIVEEARLFLEREPHNV